MVSFDHYAHELYKQLQDASKRGVKSIVITAAELNLAVGGRPGFMDSCFEVLQSEVGPNDEVLVEADGGKGLAIRFSLPRASAD